jgi:very-short-patch-repair endonuclease
MTKQCKGCGEDFEQTKRYETLYCSQDCYWNNGLTGDTNPFYGKTHSDEALDKLRDGRCAHYGEDNGFYGKQHSEKTKALIREKNKVWRDNNKELRLERRLERKGLTRELLAKHWEVYTTQPVNRDYFRNVVGVDPRTFQSLLIACGIKTREEINKTTEIKQLFQTGTSISAPEMELYGLLIEEFGKSNVEHQAKRFGYWYDFCVFGNILVEYDGYYYHKVISNKNDAIKEDLALTNGFRLVRIEEDENRFVDWKDAMKKVKKAVEAAA